MPESVLQPAPVNTSKRRLRAMKSASASTPFGSAAYPGTKCGRANIVLFKQSGRRFMDFCQTTSVLNPQDTRQPLAAQQAGSRLLMVFRPRLLIAMPLWDRSPERNPPVTPSLIDVCDLQPTY